MKIGYRRKHGYCEDCKIEMELYEVEIGLSGKTDFLCPRCTKVYGVKQELDHYEVLCRLASKSKVSQAEADKKKEQILQMIRDF